MGKTYFDERFTVSSHRNDAGNTWVTSFYTPHQVPVNMFLHPPGIKRVIS